MSAENKSENNYGQYGMKSKEDPHPLVPPSNSSSAEVPGVGPADAVDSGGHRIGKVEDRPSAKPSSRLGQAVIEEVDDKNRD